MLFREVLAGACIHVPMCTILDSNYINEYVAMHITVHSPVQSDRLCVDPHPNPFYLYLSRSPYRSPSLPPSLSTSTTFNE